MSLFADDDLSSVVGTFLDRVWSLLFTGTRICSDYRCSPDHVYCVLFLFLVSDMRWVSLHCVYDILKIYSILQVDVLNIYLLELVPWLLILLQQIT